MTQKTLDIDFEPYGKYTLFLVRINCCCKPFEVTQVDDIVTLTVIFEFLYQTFWVTKGRAFIFQL